MLLLLNLLNNPIYSLVMVLFWHFDFVFAGNTFVLINLF